ncbi:phosphoglycerate mutase (2,3-diphosphoglycerate-independent) [Helicobacter sp. TUL]|uniref:2,3-bisphosphoglycerate-independent phosphoglycerate mutase n=1 Tax=Helicobacter sp. TUL TaxID=1848928 RepID=UPI000BAB3A73|nr:2,3-bisphosphoglycerate-independent phosphoglycerate mutase [Helicobacter sp. TUL]PAV00274.1 phosphoglycerate mutase (2,3-diphosphoglycerate-independent) [Helicobacter sp. TUL]
MHKKAVLVITDGIGYSQHTTYNAFYHAKKPTYDYLFENVPYAMIHTYGLSVGLPEEQMGNSEVGHMCIGSGRVLYQDLVKISLALENGEIQHNKAFLHVADSCEDIHLCGLMSDGGVHSHLSHLLGLATICATKNKRVWLHLITDGRDVLPQSALEYLNKVQHAINAYPNIHIATLSGRFYAMDRDKRWDRIESAYNAIVCADNTTTKTPQEYIQSQYKQEIFDEFIPPVSFAPYQGMHDNDGFIFVNFRSDRARQIVDAIGNTSFDGFVRKRVPKLHIATMCEYDSSFEFPIMFPKDKVQNTLAEVISNASLRQFHTAETEKYAHVTFFLNGGREEEFESEKRVLIPSPKVTTYDLQPQMSAEAVGDAVLEAMQEGYDFVVVNFANGDMVGHTGNFQAAIKAVEAVDTQLGRIIESAKKLGYAVVITSDHGNCEEMKDSQGNTLTNHTVGDVWAFVLDENVKEVAKEGGLNNIAPTILKLMNLPKPQEMDNALF